MEVGVGTGMGGRSDFVLDGGMGDRSEDRWSMLKLLRAGARRFGMLFFPAMGVRFREAFAVVSTE